MRDASSNSRDQFVTGGTAVTVIQRSYRVQQLHF
jgi:hypothetical protein